MIRKSNHIYFCYDKNHLYPSVHLPTAFRVEAKSMIAFSSKCSAMMRLMKKHGIPRKNLIMIILSTSESVRL